MCGAHTNALSAKWLFLVVAGTCELQSRDQSLGFAMWVKADSTVWIEYSTFLL